MMSEFKTTIPRGLPFPYNGAVQPPHIRFADTVVCHSERRYFVLGDRTVAYDHHYANYSPGLAYRASLPHCSKSDGYVEHDPVVLKTEGGVPQVVTIRGEVFAIPRGDGTFWYHKPLPERICPVARLSEAAEDEIRELLADQSIGAIQHKTLAPRKAIECVAETLRETEGEAMCRDGVRPSLVNLNTLFVPGSDGRKQAVLHLVASDLQRNLHWTLAVIDLAVGRDWAAAAVAEILGDLPHPEVLQTLVIDGGARERYIAAEALEMVQASRPDVRPRVVIDPFHIERAFRKALAALRETHLKRCLALDSGQRWQNLGQLHRQSRHDIQAAARLLELQRPAQAAKRLDAWRCLERAFAAAPELKLAYGLLEGLRQVFDSRSAFEAEVRYAAWRQALAASGLRCFEGPARRLDNHWPAVRAGFETTESGGGGFQRGLAVNAAAAASLAHQIMVLRSRWRSSSIERLVQRVIARQGYIARIRRDETDD